MQPVMGHEFGFKSSKSRPQAVIYEALGAVTIESGIKAEIHNFVCSSAS
jgi:hypothetical protein